MTAGAIELNPREISEYFRIRVPRLRQTRTAQWRGPCPIHKGQADNFAVEAATGRWTCFSGCGGAGGDIFELEERLHGGDFPTRKAEVFRLVGHVEPEYRRNGYRTNGSSAAAGLREVERYPYVDQNGELLFEVVRYRKPDGGKVFRQCRPDGHGGVIWDLEGVDRVPYRLPKVLTATHVFLTEGEKDVHSLEEWEWAASCNPGGCGASRLYELWKDYFKGKHIAVLPDNDEPGRKHALAVVGALLNVAASVRIVELPGLPEKGDVTDWKEAGGTFEQFREITRRAEKLDSRALSGLRARWGLTEEKPHEARAEEAGDWPKPQPIQGELPPVQAFSEELLPDSFRPLVADVTDRMQVPMDYPAVVMALCLAGAVNRRAVIQPKANDTGWRVVPNLWGGIIAPPGFMKSPVIQAVTRPLEHIQADWWRGHEEALKDYATAKEEHELRRAAWKEQFKAASKVIGRAAPDRSEGEPAEPKLQRLIANDCTFEALHRMMSENPAGILVIRDELTGWLSRLDREENGTERAFALQAWDGSTPYTVDRIGRGTIHVDGCCMSMLGGIQPGRLRSYLVDALRDGPGNDGLLQRFQLLVWPDTAVEWGYVDRKPSADSEEQAASVFRKLVEIDTENTPLFRFDRDAQGLFIEWLTELEAKVRGDEFHPALISHLSKYRSLMPSLAVLFHLADSAARGGDPGAVSLQHAQQAAAWCEYLESHARRIYSCITTPQMQSARELADKIKQRKIGTDGFFSCRDVYLKGWSGLDSPEAVKQAADVLQDAGWIRDVSAASGPAGGRPSTRYQVNPGVWQ